MKILHTDVQSANQQIIVTFSTQLLQHLFLIIHRWLTFRRGLDRIPKLFWFPFFCMLGKINILEIFLINFFLHLRMFCSGTEHNYKCENYKFHMVHFESMILRFFFIFWVLIICQKCCCQKIYPFLCASSVNVLSFDYNTETWVVEVISKDMKWHQNTKCFNCRRLCHLRRDCRQHIPKNNVSSGNDKDGRSQPSELYRRCSKGQYWTNECRSIRYKQGKPLTLGNILGSLSQVHWSNMGLLTPSHCGEHASPGKLENPLSVVQNHTALNDRINIEDQSKISIEIRKHIFEDFYKLSKAKAERMNKWYCNWRITGHWCACAYYSPESWHLNRPLREIDVQFLWIGTPSQVKQNMWWVDWIVP